MTTTSHLDLPYILPSQAQKHVTHNEALAVLDSLVQLSVLDRDASNPPASPAEGDRYIVGASPSGAWAGMSNAVAVWLGGAWTFRQPETGWLAWVVDEADALVWSGAEWTPLSSLETSLQNLERVGIAMSADAGNPLAAKLNAALLTARAVSEGGTGDVRLKLNKPETGGFATQLFQRAYSGRAEIGLAGSDDLSVKVSANGVSWKDAILVRADSGRVEFPQTSVMTDHILNLFGDSGRFSPSTGFTVGAFTFPGYLWLYNSSTASGIGKFIHDNTDYGGSAGTLHASVRALIDKIRDPGNRRYELEFWVAEVTHGAGSAIALSHEGNTYYLGLLTEGPRPPAFSFHCYIRAMDQPILVEHAAGMEIRKDGVAYQTHVVLSPADGWVSLGITHRTTSHRMFDGYRPRALTIYTRGTANRFHIGCPTLIGGLTSFDPDIGLVAAAKMWGG